MAENNPIQQNYGDDAIQTLSPRELVRLRPGMYIGKLGDGTQSDDGIYVLIKEVTDNSIDEYMNGYGRQIEITIGNAARAPKRIQPSTYPNANCPVRDSK